MDTIGRATMPPLATGTVAAARQIRRRARALLVLTLAATALIPVATTAARPTRGIWAITGSMQHTRGFQAATLLPDGRVLVAGGCTDGACDPNTARYLASAELYHPHTGSWAATGSMHDHRVQFTATLLRTGQVLVAGGWSGTQDGFLTSAELYNPGTGTWHRTGSLHYARAWPTATLLANGQVLVAGGGNQMGNLSSAELYNPRTGRWTETGFMHSARGNFTAALLADGEVLAAGGNDHGGPIANAELFNPRTGTWTPTGSLHQPRGWHTAIRLLDGRVVVAGGTDGRHFLTQAEIYNPHTGRWNVTGALHATRDYSTAESAVLLRNGGVLIAGNGGCAAGAGGVCQGGTPDARAELYNPHTGLWSVTGSLDQARGFQTTTLLPTGQVLVAGGTGSGSLLAEAELYTQ